MDFKIYITVLFACAGAGALLTWWAIAFRETALERWESLPRNKYLGGVLALITLLWCIPQAKPIVWDWMLPWLLPLAIAFAILAFMFLDHLLSRAVGGFLILLAYYLLHESFTFHTPLGWVFALLCWTFGIAGMFFSGKPYLMRDFMRAVTRRKRVRIVSTAFFAVFAFYCLTVGILHAAH